jgi:DNA-binding MarR family transcriptional regulator
LRTTSADHELASRLRHVLARSARRLRQAAGPELSPSQTAALAVIEREGPLTPSEVAQRERIQRPSATRTLARLEQAGLITRAADPGDRRSALVTTTPAGSALLAAARTRKDAFLSARLDALDAEDRATLERAAALLERMLEEPGA